MNITDSLRQEIHIILLFHIPCLLMLTALTTYIMLKTPKGALKRSYQFLVSTIFVWLIAKILKTVSPTLELRWFFVVIQYLGIQFLGFAMFLFAYTYTHKKYPPKGLLLVLVSLSGLGFIIVASNPFHYLFYRYFTFYKDAFGPLFLPLQSIQYVYMIISIAMLGKHYIQDESRKPQRKLARLLGIVTLLPLIANLYYIMFKVIDIPWIFSFPVFDITPVAISLSLTLFLIPAVNHRFLDILPLSYQKLIDHLNQPIAYATRHHLIYAYNAAFSDAFPHITYGANLKTCLHNDFTTLYSPVYQIHYKSNPIQVRQKWVYQFIDLSRNMKLLHMLEEKHEQLVKTTHQLETLNAQKRMLLDVKARLNTAQDLHDLLGHSFTVAIGICELAASKHTHEDRLEKAHHVKEILLNSLSDLKTDHAHFSTPHQANSLIHTLQMLNYPNIDVLFEVQGKPYPLSDQKSEAIYRLCLESITNAMHHGKAKQIHIFLRFDLSHVKLFIIDDGVGSHTIKKNHGLQGIEKRIHACHGTVTFGSDGNKGFYTHATLPAK